MSIFVVTQRSLKNIPKDADRRSSDFVRGIQRQSLFTVPRKKNICHQVN